MPFGDIEEQAGEKKFILLINDLLLKIINLNLSMKHITVKSFYLNCNVLHFALKFSKLKLLSRLRSG